MNVKTFTAMTEAGLDRKVNNLLNGNSFYDSRITM